MGMVADRCWHGHLTWREDDFEALAFNNPARAYARLHSNIRYRVETCLGLAPQTAF